ncbi:hypothetical protein ACFWA9_10135 [Kitasatospora sp. NPDC059973]|uniref:hypothetical protein n=1 Tax=Kitasatospora sp. NPDC059973 TaxID=3347020 RepID=UPI00367BDC74
MVKNRAKKMDTREYAEDHDLTHAQAAQELARKVLPELPDGGFPLELWREPDWDAGETDIPRCFECANELPVGEVNIRFPQLTPGRDGLCRLCLPLLREKLDQAAALLGER